MTKSDLIKEIKATYEKHGWELKSALLRPETIAEVANSRENILSGATIEDSSFDALWFWRPSHSDAEAWEKEKRAEVFQSMEERLRQYVTGS
jgi:hypothetical protein